MFEGISNYICCLEETRFFHFLRFNRTRPFRRSIEEGSTSMDVPSKRSSFKFSISSIISGKFLSFEQPNRKRHSKDFKLKIHVGRLLRFLHLFISNKTRRLICLIEDGSSSIAIEAK